MPRKKHRRRKTNNNSNSNVLEGNNKSETKNEKTQDGIDSNTSGLPVFDSQDDVNNSLLSGFESSEEMGLRPYDPDTNYLSPRPKFLCYSPDRHREIIARIERFATIMRSDSSDDEMPVLEGESESNIDRSVKETEGIVGELVGNCEEHETDNEDDENFEEFGDDDKWSVNVFLQYLLVMVAVILTTLFISSMNSPPVLSTESMHWFNVSETEGEAFGPMMLMAGYQNRKRDQNDLTASSKELVARQNEQPEDDEVGDFETVETAKNNEIEPLILISEKIETLQVEDEIKVYIQLLENLGSSKVNEESEILKPMVDEDDGNKKRDENDLTVSTKELVTMQHEQPEDEEVGDLEAVETNEKISNEWIEPMILINEKIETDRVEDEINVYIQLLGAADLNSSEVNEESEILKPMVDENDGNNSLNESSNSVAKVADFGPLFAAFSAIAVVIFASTSVLYCSMQTKVSSPIGHIDEVIDESGSVGSFGSKSSMFSEYHEGNKDASSSNQTNYFDFQKSSADSPSHASFTIEKKIVKKQRSKTPEKMASTGKTPEKMASTVRRSSRIHNRSISSP